MITIDKTTHIYGQKKKKNTHQEDARHTILWKEVVLKSCLQETLLSPIPRHIFMSFPQLNKLAQSCDHGGYGPYSLVRTWTSLTDKQKTDMSYQREALCRLCNTTVTDRLFWHRNTIYTLWVLSEQQNVTADPCMSDWQVTVCRRCGLLWQLCWLVSLFHLLACHLGTARCAAFVCNTLS